MALSQIIGPSTDSVTHAGTGSPWVCTATPYNNQSTMRAGDIGIIYVGYRTVGPAATFVPPTGYTVLGSIDSPLVNSSYHHVAICGKLLTADGNQGTVDYQVSDLVSNDPGYAISQSGVYRPSGGKSFAPAKTSTGADASNNTTWTPALAVLAMLAGDIALVASNMACGGTAPSISVNPELVGTTRLSFPQQQYGGRMLVFLTSHSVDAGGLLGSYSATWSGSTTGVAVMLRLTDETLPLLFNCLVVQALAPLPANNPATLASVGDWLRIRITDPNSTAVGGSGRQFTIQALYGNSDGDLGTAEIWNGSTFETAFVGCYREAVAGGHDFYLHPAAGDWPTTKVKIRVREI